MWRRRPCQPLFRPGLRVHVLPAGPLAHPFIDSDSIHTEGVGVRVLECNPLSVNQCTALFLTWGSLVKQGGGGRGNVCMQKKSGAPRDRCKRAGRIRGSVGPLGTTGKQSCGQNTRVATTNKKHSTKVTEESPGGQSSSRNQSCAGQGTQHTHTAYHPLISAVACRPPTVASTRAAAAPPLLPAAAAAASTFSASRPASTSNGATWLKPSSQVIWTA